MTMPPAGPQPGYQGPQGPQPTQPPQGYGDPTVAISRPNQQQAPQRPQNPVQPQNGQSQIGQPQQQAPKPKGSGAVLLLGLVSILGVVLGLSISENNANAWDSVNAWGGVAIAGAIAVLAPALGRSLGLTAQRAWQVAVCGAGALVLFWVLFTLPSVGS